jgi:hypothetical protein
MNFEGTKHNIFKNYSSNPVSKKNIKLSKKNTEILT